MAKRGRLLKFETPELLQAKIDEYFYWAEKNKKPFTIGRLCCFLDCDRVTLLNYSAKESFFSTIKKAKQKIEAWKEEQLLIRTNVTGLIFDLKNNHGWKDKTETDITSGGQSIVKFVDVTKEGNPIGGSCNKTKQKDKSIPES